jgi:hypothetical protein
MGPWRRTSPSCPELLRWINSIASAAGSLHSRRAAPTTPTSVMIAEAVATVHDRRRYSGEWPEVLKEETAKRVAEEQQRLAEEQRRTAANRAVYERSLPR